MIIASAGFRYHIGKFHSYHFRVVFKRTVLTHEFGTGYICQGELLFRLFYVFIITCLGGVKTWLINVCQINQTSRYGSDTMLLCFNHIRDSELYSSVGNISAYIYQTCLWQVK